MVLCYDQLGVLIAFTLAHVLTWLLDSSIPETELFRSGEGEATLRISDKRP